MELGARLRVFFLTVSDLMDETRVGVTLLSEDEKDTGGRVGENRARKTCGMGRVRQTRGVGGARDMWGGT